MALYISVDLIFKKNVIFVTITRNSEMYRTDWSYCVGSGSCHNGCILNVFDQVVHCGPLFPSASSTTGSVLDWRIGRKEVGVGFVLVF